tara:strand:+ start:94 stop:345 length:252 start_codon:yes stop_codon:yes gene_type:complete
MGRSWLDETYHERTAKEDANRGWSSAKRSGDQVKRLRQTIVDMVEHFAGDSLHGARIDETLLQIVIEAGYDQHLINRITRKIK